ncbi:MAG TPA: FlgD immunoglobulin-like domain containing protein [Gaiellaceae bacterium]|nr:FlgD immunoglobulin-like domain containing protein [Gaiellaceae bacterium]
MTRLAPTVVVVCLLAATAVAFAVTERLKLKESPILSTRIDELVSPVCNACPPGAREARIAFRLRREDELTLAIVDADGDVVRDDLVSGRFRPMLLKFAWDGRDDSGRIVPDGLYRAQVRLADEDRTLEFPNAIRVDSTAPEVEHVEVRPAVISPDGDGRRDRVKVRYSFSEPAYAVLYVDGKRRPRSYRRLSTGSRQWYGLRGRRGLPAGTHRLALAALDAAGNLGPSTREFTVRIRYVELSRHVYRAPAASRLRVGVSTDATTLRYALAGGGRRLSGKVRAKRSIRAFSLRVPGEPGRYVLTVTANGRGSHARLVVRRPG